MGLGIISLFFLVAFTLLYLSKALANQPAFMVKAVDKITANIEPLAFWGVVYSLVAFILTPLLVSGGFTVMIMLLANILLFLLALPYTLEHMLAKYPDKVSPAIARELKSLVGAVTDREKVAGYAGAALSFLLFLALTR